MPKDENNKRRPVPPNLPKNDPSIRTLPLTDDLKERLLEIRTEQKEFKKKFGNSYNNEWDGYICVKPDGSLITPDYVTKEYPRFLEKHNLPRICFHNLRHIQILTVRSITVAAHIGGMAANFVLVTISEKMYWNRLC